jgi:hypothetical protein
MKKILFTVLIFSNYHLFAQDCIPNPASYSAGIVNALRYKTKDSLAAKTITWKDIEPIYDSILAQTKKDTFADQKVPPRDTAEQEIEVKLVKDLNDNLDTLFKRGNRIGIDWKNIVFKDDASKISHEKDMPSTIWFNDGKVEFISGDSSFEISYKAMLINGVWKLDYMGTRLKVFDRDGTELGLMTSSYNDFSKAGM